MFTLTGHADRLGCRQVVVVELLSRQVVGLLNVRDSGGVGGQGGGLERVAILESGNNFLLFICHFLVHHFQVQRDSPKQSGPAYSIDRAEVANHTLLILVEPHQLFWLQWLVVINFLGILDSVLGRQLGRLLNCLLERLVSNAPLEDRIVL